MPDLEPAQFTVYGIPVEDSNVISLEFRQLIEALARQFFTTDDAFPNENRDGQPRVLANDPANIKFQIYYNGAYRTIAQNIQSGIAVPTKQIIQIPASGPLQQWVIDHNLGSQVLVQAYDQNWNLLQAVPLTPVTERVHLATIPAAVLTTLGVGVTVLRPALPTPLSGSFLSAEAVAQEVVGGVPVGQLEFEIAGQGVMTGGEIALSTAVLGGVISGVAATANNTLTAGGTLEIRANMTTAPTGGALELFAYIQRGINQGTYRVNHPTEDRVIIEHPAPLAGFAILVG